LPQAAFPNFCHGGILDSTEKFSFTLAVDPRSRINTFRDDFSRLLDGFILRLVEIHARHDDTIRTEDDDGIVVQILQDGSVSEKVPVDFTSRTCAPGTFRDVRLPNAKWIFAAVPDSWFYQ